MPSAQRSSAPNIRDGVTWERGPDDFATRIEAGDVGGLVKLRVNINDGTNALILVDGAARGVAGPGPAHLSAYSPKVGFLDWLRPPRKVTAIIIDTSDVQVSFHVKRVTTRDREPVNVDVAVRFRVPYRPDAANPDTGKSYPVDFYRNVMKDRRRFTFDDWRAYLEPEIVSAVSQFVRGCALAELNGDMKRKVELEAHLLQHLKQTCRSAGMEFSDVRAIGVEDLTAAARVAAAAAEATAAAAKAAAATAAAAAAAKAAAERAEDMADAMQGFELLDEIERRRDAKDKPTPAGS